MIKVIEDAIKDLEARHKIAVGNRIKLSKKVDSFIRGFDKAVLAIGPVQAMFDMNFIFDEIRYFSNAKLLVSEAYADSNIFTKFKEERTGDVSIFRFFISSDVLGRLPPGSGVLSLFEDINSPINVCSSLRPYLGSTISRYAAVVALAEVIYERMTTEEKLMYSQKCEDHRALMVVHS